MPCGQTIEFANSHICLFANLLIMKKYITPEAELTSMASERAFLGGASEIPFGGETGEFDTRAQNLWEEDPPLIPPCREGNGMGE